ncbi:ribbon-helix-helix domain-containing protein [Algihabitans albus]|uniref:ribbon-helix-helix domain-containing protein n=1 Tax=Algihabitans albus TaxID=2164067 RepID=UPI000E5D1461|nr:ribbon-helix-helix domain-containing protein [Algihabitans albus]
MCRIFAGQPQSNYAPERRSVRLGGYCTSIQLEQVFWRILEEIAASEGVSLAKFISVLHDEVIETHGEARNFTSMLRCCCLIYLDRTGADAGLRFAVPSGLAALSAAE